MSFKKVVVILILLLVSIWLIKKDSITLNNSIKKIEKEYLKSGKEHKKDFKNSLPLSDLSYDVVQALLAPKPLIKGAHFSDDTTVIINLNETEEYKTMPISNCREIALKNKDNMARMVFYFAQAIKNNKNIEKLFYTLLSLSSSSDFISGETFLMIFSYMGKRKSIEELTKEERNHPLLDESDFFNKGFNTFSLEYIGDLIERNVLPPDVVKIVFSLYSQIDYTVIDDFDSLKQELTLLNIQPTPADALRFIEHMSDKNISSNRIYDGLKSLFDEMNFSEFHIYYTLYSQLQIKLAALNNVNLYRFFYERGLRFDDPVGAEFHNGQQTAIDRLLNIYFHDRDNLNPEQLDNMMDIFEYLIAKDIGSGDDSLLSRVQDDNSKDKFIDMVQSYTKVNDMYKPTNEVERFSDTEEIKQYYELLGLNNERIQQIRALDREFESCRENYTKRRMKWHESESPVVNLKKKQNEYYENKILAFKRLKSWAKNEFEKGVSARALDIYLTKKSQKLLLYRWQKIISDIDKNVLNKVSKALLIYEPDLIEGIEMSLRDKKFSIDELNHVLELIISTAFQKNSPMALNEFIKNGLPKKEIYQKFLYAIADTARERYHPTPFPGNSFFDVMKGYEFDFSQSDDLNNTVLMYALVFGKESQFKYFLKEKVPFIISETSMNPLDFALATYSPEKPEIVETLLKHGHPVDETHKELVVWLEEQYPGKAPKL